MSIFQGDNPLTADAVDIRSTVDASFFIGIGAIIIGDNGMYINNRGSALEFQYTEATDTYVVLDDDNPDLDLSGVEADLLVAGNGFEAIGGGAGLAYTGADNFVPLANGMNAANGLDQSPISVTDGDAGAMPAVPTTTTISGDFVLSGQTTAGILAVDSAGNVDQRALVASDIPDITFGDTFPWNGAAPNNTLAAAITAWNTGAGSDFAGGEPTRILHGNDIFAILQGSPSTEAFIYIGADSTYSSGAAATPQIVATDFVQISMTNITGKLDVDLGNVGTPSDAAGFRTAIGAGTSSLVIGTTATTALAGNTTTITSAQATAITTNSGKTSFPGFGTGAGTALEGNTVLLQVGTAATDALAGNTTTITTTQAANIVTNNGKTSFPGFGVAAGTALEGNEATVVRTSGDQTIGGTKTFNSDIAGTSTSAIEVVEFATTSQTRTTDTLKFWKGTQAEYTNIGAPNYDDQTIYLIQG